MTASKIVAAAASGAGGGAGLDVDEVFSTFLYDGTGANQAINNGIDLSGEGGLVWLKSRDGSSSAFHTIYDTARGTGPNGGRIFGGTASTNAASTQSDGLQSFNSNGFTLGANLFENGTNASYGTEYVSWTFRKALNFFDCLIYTGDGSSSNTISHNLGSIPAFVVVKRTDSTGDWHVAARQSNGSYIHGNASFPTALNLTSAGNSVTSTSGASDMSLTSTTFDAKKINGFNTHNGSGNLTNINGATYVAYLFAHNNNDGEFGPSSDQDVIKCGTYDTDGNGDATVNLGFEPQFVLVKCSTAASNWYLLDTMRGMSNDNPVENARLFADTSGAESSTEGTSGIVPTSTGFFHDGYILASQTFIYMAIRRGGMAVPTDATKVFAIDTFGSTGDGKTPAWRSGFPVDMALYKIPSGASDGKIASRLTAPKYLRTNSTIAEYTDDDFTFDYNNGWYNYTGTLATYYSYMWKRAPSYLDAVCYDGNSTNGRTVTHNLSAIPEMMWVKQRGQPEDWIVYHSALGNTKAIRLNSNIAAYTDSKWNDTTPTSTVFSLDNSNIVNGSGRTYISYLFATVANVSKVGSVTHSGSSTDVNCGFSSGARLVILKRTDATGDWYIWDSVRGIVSGNDPYLLLNTNAAEVTNTDYIDPLSSGFQISGDFTDGTYIFYAIA